MEGFFLLGTPIAWSWAPENLCFTKHSWSFCVLLSICWETIKKNRIIGIFLKSPVFFVKKNSKVSLGVDPPTGWSGPPLPETRGRKLKFAFNNV